MDFSALPGVNFSETQTPYVLNKQSTPNTKRSTAIKAVALVILLILVAISGYELYDNEDTHKFFSETLPNFTTASPAKAIIVSASAFTCICILITCYYAYKIYALKKTYL